MGKPVFINQDMINIYRQAGLKPPVNKKVVDKIERNGEGEDFSFSTLINLRIVDEQDAVNRYKWSGLPSGLNGQFIERMLYYKYQLCFFYEKSTDKFYCLPYTLSGSKADSLDCYGRFKRVKPLIFAGSEDKEEREFLPDKELDPVYDLLEELDSKDGESLINNKCVLLRDYTNQLSENAGFPRYTLQEPILKLMSDLIPFCRTSLIVNSGVTGMRVNSEDEKEDAALAAKEIYRASLKGQAFVPIVGMQEFQDLGGKAPLKSEEYLLALQGLDNYRLSMYGIKTGGLFQKKAHMLEGEEEMNAGHNQFVYQDGLEIRQRFCSYVNAIYGLGIWCEANENVIEPEEILGKTDETTSMDTEPVDNGGNENV